MSQGEKNVWNAQTTAAARNLYYRDFADPRARIKALDAQLSYHYSLRGRESTTREKILRGLHRACFAPIAHSVELEIAEHVTRSDGSLAKQERLDDSSLDAFFNRGTPPEKVRSFLRAAGSIVHEVTTNFLAEASDGRHWCAPLLQEFEAINDKVADVSDDTSVLSRAYGDSALERFTAIMILFNDTTLRALAPALRHAQLWTEGDEGSARNTEQLSWLATTKSKVFARNFPAAYPNDPRPAQCPFAHDEEQIAKQGIFSAASLKKGPWSPGGDCPLDIEFYSQAYPKYGLVSGAHLRFMSMLPVARELSIERMYENYVPGECARPPAVPPAQ